MNAKVLSRLLSLPLALLLIAGLFFSPETEPAQAQRRATRTPRPTRTATPTRTPTSQSSPTATRTPTATQGPLSSATPTSPPAAGTWNLFGSPNVAGQGNRLSGLAAVSANEVWAVGSGLTPNGTSRYTLTLHWDGANWSVVSSPSPDAWINALTDASASGPNDVWAVGSLGGNSGPNAKPLILRWDGSSWSHVPAPAFSEPVNAKLNAVDARAADDVWAVGEVSGASTNWWSQPLVLHWDGNSWSIIPSPQIGTQSVLNGVEAISPNDVWAVGSTSSAGIRNLILHWDGAGWSQVVAPTSGTPEQLSGVAAVSASEVWAVGTKGSGSQTAILRYNGSAWSSVPSPNSSIVGVNRNELLRLSVVAENDIWTVGKASRSQLCGFSDAPLYYSYTFFAHWDGVSWQSVPGPNPSNGGGCSGTRNELGDIQAISAADVWAAGGWYDATLSEQTWKTLIERYTAP